MMKKYILFFALLLSTQANAQWGGWNRLWIYSGNTASPSRTTDTTQVFQLRVGTSTTAGFVPVADARGVLTMQAVSAAGAGDITSVVAGSGLSGGATSGAATVDLNPKLSGRTITVTADSVHVTDASIGATQLSSTTVAAAAYTLPSVTFDADGRATTAASVTTLTGIDAVVTDLDIASATTGNTLVRRASGVWVDSTVSSGITVAQARSNTGWTTSAGTIASDTVASRIEWGGVAGTSVKVFDADTDSIIFFPQNVFALEYKDGSTQLASIDTLGRIMSGTRTLANPKIYLNGATTNPTIIFKDSQNDSGFIQYDAGNGQIKLNINDEISPSINLEERTYIGTGGGSPASPDWLMVTEAGAGAVVARWANSTTGGTTSDGLEVGLDVNENSVFKNYENTSTFFYTSNTLRATVEGDGDVAFGAKAPASGTYTFNAKPLYVTYEGTPAATDSSVEIDVESGNGLVRLFASDGDAGELTINTTDQLLANNFSGGYSFNNRIFSGMTTLTLAAAATTFAVTKNVHEIDGDAGGNAVATITGGLTGMLLTLKFIDTSVTITDDGTATANTININTAFVSTAGDILTLLYDGTSWYEVSRSVN